MPKRRSSKNYNKPPSMKLLEKVKNFLIRRKLITRKDSVFVDNEFVYVKYSNNKEVDVNILKDGEVIHAYTVSLSRIYRSPILTFIETYSPPFVELLNTWMDLMIKELLDTESTSPDFRKFVI